jgi:uncharacterized membrane protein SpoIIM required for sporulation
MRPETFVKANRDQWTRFELILANARRGVQALSSPEVGQFVSLYRKIAADLAYARAFVPDEEVRRYLNNLLARAYPLLYVRKPEYGARIAGYFTRTFPRTLRENARYLAASALLLFVPAAISLFLSLQNPANAFYFVDTGWIDSAEEAFGKLDKGRPDQWGALMTSFYIVNNVRVALISFAGGITFGALTFFILISNGLVLGGASAVAMRHGVGENFFFFVSSHAPLELGAIVVASAAGLRVGWSMISPGRYVWKDAVRKAATEAMVLMGGVVAMLVAAAFVEGFISPSPLPGAIKLTFGLLSVTALAVYALAAGRDASSS